LPKAEQDTEEWQTAMETLLLVAERDGPAMMARIGMMQALNRHSAKADQVPQRKRAKVFRIVR
jgi:hypothetical protein